MKRKWRKIEKYCGEYQYTETNTHFIPKGEQKQHLIAWEGYETGTENNSII